MNINLTGLSAVPSDYQCPDGELDISLNLLNEGSGLAPVLPPAPVFEMKNDSERPIFIHKTPDGYRNLIIHIPAINSSQGALYWLPLSRDIEPAGKLPSTADSIYITDCQRPKSIQALGNCIVLALDDSVSFILWRGDSYTALGPRPQLPVLQFGLQRACNLAESYTVSAKVAHDEYAYISRFINGTEGRHPASKPATASSGPSSAIDLVFKELSDGVYGHLFDSYTRAIESYGMLFYQPFLVRYAFRLFDGTYIWHSSPVLMLPTTVPPLVDAASITYEEDTLNITSGYHGVNLFSLLYKIADKGVLSEWKDIIRSIDVFVSAPFYTFDQSKSVSGISKLSFNKTKHTGGRRDDEQKDFVETKRLDGIYRVSSKAQFLRVYTTDNDTKYWVFPRRDSEILDDIRSCSQFYRVASLNIDEITAAGDFDALPIEDGVLPGTLPARPTLPDDLNSHHTIAPAHLFAYNSRLSMANLTVRLAQCPLLASMLTASDSAVRTFAPTLEYRKDAASLIATRQASSLDTIPTPSSQDPIFFYIPDADASQLTLYDTDKADKGHETHTFRLQRHDFLNGAYYLGSFDIPVSSEAAEEYAPTLPQDATPSVKREGSIYLSEVNNPFLFPALSATSVSAPVLALSTAAQALSQGQFGQFPLYAFTSEGIWALELSSTGTYSARQPITRDVCINPEAITQIDSAVLFPSERGIMLLSGSSSSCISDRIFSDTASSVPQLPAIARILETSAVDSRAVSQQKTFIEFLRQGAMAYDYLHQRIVLYNPTCHYAYVYSLKTKLWGMMQSSIQYNLNAYPEALVILDRGNRDYVLADFSFHGAESSPVFLVTRPLKLDAPDILKTVRSVIARGLFKKGHVQSVLYGSRDLYNWHLVWSSKDHYLRGFSGTPYKYFRLALLGKLDAGESISGTSVEFTPRLTNQPR